MSTKAKGTYYENKLVKEFTALGYEAWKVPMSGALGHRSNIQVPDRVRQYLIGDVCVCIDDKDVAIEVKFRTANPFTNQSKQQIFNSQATSITNTLLEFKDVRIYFSIQTWISSNTASVQKLNSSVLTNEIKSWYVDTKTIFLRLKGFKHWIIMEIK